MRQALTYTGADPATAVKPAGRSSTVTNEDAMTAVGLLQHARLPALLKVEQASVLMGISRSAAYRAVATGDLPSVRFGCRLYVPTARLLELLGLGPEDR
jgi:excisionase family DNA binding protein